MGKKCWQRRRPHLVLPQKLGLEEARMPALPGPTKMLGPGCALPFTSGPHKATHLAMRDRTSLKFLAMTVPRWYDISFPRFFAVTLSLRLKWAALAQRFRVRGFTTLTFWGIDLHRTTGCQPVLCSSRNSNAYFDLCATTG
jgi:hypothetical protein